MAEYNPFTAGLEPAPGTTKVRRLVTGLDATGKSTIVMDEECPHASVGHGTPAYVVTNLWRTDESPADNHAPLADPYATDEPLSVGPTRNGSVFRVLELPPDKDWRFDADGTEVKPLAFHTTDSIDYAIVLSGEIWAVLDATEVKMTAGDVLVQRGTAHAWSNRSDSPCVLAFVLIGGTKP
ncbi:cupin domain-containing protein [Amycolatopsis acidicola]|uniref:Cupin domain-containing protein n=1 Tax=Amycolatopsis acidicola TaxID=2596893 RepID=A0A5N0V5N7_9PSEU|nr:cupin domain-containing protein [Amycolatopsis acidicola]KAA9160708.1 cupin domain-containing protein [Amycolatopsis acidicola]